MSFSPSLSRICQVIIDQLANSIFTQANSSKYSIMEILTTTTNYSLDTRRLAETTESKSNRTSEIRRIHSKVLSICQSLNTRQGVHSISSMKAAGFQYTGNGDTALCDACGLEVSNWVSTMKPFCIHAERSPSCSFVCSRQPTKRASAILTDNLNSSNSTLNDEERSPKRQKIEIIQENRSLSTFAEVELLKEIRIRTFSHWPHRRSPTNVQMIEAGFFNCNVGDRVICIYCNLICQQWTPHTDDPCDVHKTLFPKCPYVVAIFKHSPVTSIPIVNATATRNNSLPDNSVSCDQIVSTDVCHTAYREIPKRYASFNTWSNENSPSVDDLVRAGFYYTGTKTIVTCFYCGGSLQNWTATDNPTVEHARWFPPCAYAKQLCGDKQYRYIQESNRRRKELQEKIQSVKASEPSIGHSSGGRLIISDESTLNRYVAARLDLPISQKMLDRDFRLSIVKRCWEDQLRLKGNDYTNDIDLFIACTILQKQIDCINGKKENIIIPSVAMNKIREKEQTLVDLSNNTDVEMASSLQSNTGETTTKSLVNNVAKKADMKSDSATDLSSKSADSSSPLNPCSLCLSEEKCLAFVPCGHVAACVSCGHSVRSCPICRSEIKAFVRVYL